MREIHTGVREIRLVGLPVGTQTLLPTQGGPMSVVVSQVDGVLTIAVGERRRVTPAHCPAVTELYGVPYRCALTGPHDLHTSAVGLRGVQWRDE